MTAVDDLVRASLAERAGDITAVPPDLLDREVLDPAHGPRRPWLVAVAVAAVVLVVAGIVVALRSREVATPRPAAPPRCDSPSATAWRAALDRHVLRTPHVLAGLAGGSFVEQDGDELTMRGPTGTVTNLMVLPANAQPLIDVDRNQFVMQLPGDENAYVYDSRPVGGSIEMRPDAQAVVIQGSRLYYTTTYRGGEAVEYDLGRHTSRVLYRGGNLMLVHDTGLSVRWHGGQAAEQLSPAVRKALAGVDPNTIDYSGGSYEIASPRGTRIVGPDGTVTGPFESRGGKYGLRVAGHYLLQQATPTGHVRIYDTRTGAVLDSGTFGTVRTAGSRFALEDVHGVRIIDTNALPELRC